MPQPYLDNFDEWHFIYSYQTPGVSPGAPFPALPLQTQADADFIWRASMVDSIDVNGAGSAPVGGAPPVAFKIYLPDGRAIQNVATSFAGQSPGLEGYQVIANNGAIRPIAMIPEVMLVRGSTMFADVANIFTFGPLNWELGLRGVKLFPKGTRYQIDKTRKYRARPFTYWAELTNFALGQTIQQVVTLDSDTQFLLYAIDAGAVNSGIRFQFYGPAGERTSNCPLAPQNPDNGFISMGLLTGIARAPGVICPPIAYPKAGQIAFAYQVPVTFAGIVRRWFLGFQGVRLWDK